MININYQRFGNKGFQLRLRLYQDGESRFISVTKLLKGNLYSKHWNQQKQQLIHSAPFSEENNAILVKFRQKYDEMAVNWKGSIFSMLAAMENPGKTDDATTVRQYIQVIIDRLSKHRHADGTIKGSFEPYQKVERRLQEFCKTKNIDYENFL